MVVIDTSLVCHEHDKMRWGNGHEGHRWRWSVDEAIREVQVVVWVQDRWSLANFSDGLGRRENRLIIHYIFMSALFHSECRSALTVKTKLPCSPHTLGVGIVLEVLVYILVKVDEVRENAAGALKEIAGTGMNGMYPVTEARVEPVCLPWR